MTLSTNGSLADELRKECDRLRQLAEALQAREDALAARERELATLAQEYPRLKAEAHGLMVEKLRREIPPLPDDVDLDAYIQQHDGLPLEAFLDQL